MLYSWFIFTDVAFSSARLNQQLTLMVEVVDVFWTGSGHELSWRSFRPAHYTVPLWRAESICRNNGNVDI